MGVIELTKRGRLVISLDFELYWGVRDIMTIEQYRKNLLGVRQAIPKMLELFKEFEIHTTWATVGFLFFETKKELLNHLPEEKPNYIDDILSPYLTMEHIGENEEEDPYHFGLSLIHDIASVPHQEMGTHTFSHYYCLEEGQTVEAFKADLDAANKIGKAHNMEMKSLAFPRNQFNEEYLSVCKELGITSYRGNEASWMYSPSRRKDETLWKKGVRFLDAYINLSGHNTYPDELVEKTIPINIPSSRFLRPHYPDLKLFEPMRLSRILKSMTYAAKNQQVYHLWWHPHNFGNNIEENISFLRKILEHYSKLKQQYHMDSLSMGELAEELLNER